MTGSVKGSGRVSVSDIHADIVTFSGSKMKRPDVRDYLSDARVARVDHCCPDGGVSVVPKCTALNHGAHRSDAEQNRTPTATDEAAAQCRRRRRRGIGPGLADCPTTIDPNAEFGTRVAMAEAWCDVWAKYHVPPAALAENPDIRTGMLHAG